MNAHDESVRPVIVPVVQTRRQAQEGLLLSGAQGSQAHPGRARTQRPPSAPTFGRKGTAPGQARVSLLKLKSRLRAETAKPQPPQTLTNENLEDKMASARKPRPEVPATSGDVTTVAFLGTPRWKPRGPGSSSGGDSSSRRTPRPRWTARTAPGRVRRSAGRAPRAPRSPAQPGGAGLRLF